jgi:citrate lyase beta subunit
MIFKDIKELEEIVKNNDIKKALNLIGNKKLKTKKTKKRSALMVSGHNVKHLNKIDEIKADIIILNLEDGVPKEKKEIAKIMIAIFLSNIDFLNKEIIIRVNPLNESGKEEIKFLDKFSFDGFRIVKVKSNKDIDDATILTNKEIHASIETKEAFFNLTEINHPQLTTFYLGIYDLLNSFNLAHSIITLENPLIHNIISEYSLKSRFIEKIPMGFVYQQYKDLEGFSKWSNFQKNLGINGISCITPKQVEIANKIFDEDTEFAKIIVERFENVGPFTIDGLFVDEPIYKNYKRILKNF